MNIRHLQFLVLIVITPLLSSCWIEAGDSGPVDPGEPDAVPYEIATESNLPTGSLSGNSMDAQSADLDGDGEGDDGGRGKRRKRKDRRKGDPRDQRDQRVDQQGGGAAVRGARAQECEGGQRGAHVAGPPYCLAWRMVRPLSRLSAT